MYVSKIFKSRSCKDAFWKLLETILHLQDSYTIQKVFKYLPTNQYVEKVHKCENI